MSATLGPKNRVGPAGKDGKDGQDGARGPKGDKGEKGDRGLTGPRGAGGAQGIGVPAGGTTNQVLKKSSNADYDTTWGTSGGSEVFISSILGLYKVQTNTTPPPSNGHIRYDNSTQINSSNIYVYDITNENINIDIFLGKIKNGSIFVVQDKDDHLNYQIWEVNGDAVDNTTYWTIPVLLSSSGGTGTTNFANNHEVFLASMFDAKILPIVSPITASDIDWSLLRQTGGIYTKALGANETFTFSNMSAGQTILVRLTNDSNNWTVTWPSVKWAGGVAPTMTIGAKSDVYTFVYDGTDVFGSFVQDMY